MNISSKIDEILMTLAHRVATLKSTNPTIKDWVDGRNELIAKAKSDLLSLCKTMMSGMVGEDRDEILLNVGKGEEAFCHRCFASGYNKRGSEILERLNKIGGDER